MRQMWERQASFSGEMPYWTCVCCTYGALHPLVFGSGVHVEVINCRSAVHLVLVLNGRHKKIVDCIYLYEQMGKARHEKA